MRLKIISDDTNEGTKLIDEDSGEMIHLVQKLNFECNATDVYSKVTIELFNVPVEIVTKAEVDTYEFGSGSNSNSSEKKIKIVSEKVGENFTPLTKIIDVSTGNPISAVQEVKWEASPTQRDAKIKRIKI